MKHVVRRKGATHPNLSHTQVRVSICDQVRDTEKKVPATRCSVFTPRRVHDIRSFLYAKSLKQIYMALKESLAITNVDLAIERLRPCCHHCCEGDEEEVCDQRGLQFGLCHSRSARNASLNGLWRALFLRDVGVLSSLFSLKNCEIVRGGLEKSSRARIGPAC